MTDDELSRMRASAAVEAIGWRFLLGGFATSVGVASVRDGLEVAGAALRACEDDADEHLRMDVRADRVELSLLPQSTGWVSETDVVLAHRISAALGDLGYVTTVAAGMGGRSVQELEIAIDTMDVGAIRPFWKAVFGYVDAPSSGGGAIVDPAGQGPPVWFQRMDEPRPQRNRVHFDITVPHDEAERRVRDALAAGGVVVSAAAARAFWVLADAEGNEVCVCTWQDRDPPVVA